MGGSSDNSAQNAANQAEQERQAQIAASTSAINKIFSDPSRTSQYDKLASDTTQYYTNDLNRQNTIQQRNLKFALARQGLAGGSQQAAEGGQLGQAYQKGLLQASQYGQQAKANLMNSDESTRMQLLGMAQTGSDTSTSSQMATQGLQSNLQSAQGTAQAQQLGGLFDNFANIYSNSQNQKAQQQAMLYGYGSIFSPMFGPGSNGGGGYSYGY